MFDNYEKFKKDVYALTKIDLNYYKEKQMPCAEDRQGQI